MNLPTRLAAALLVSSPALLAAQIDFSVVSISEPLTPTDLQAALAAPSTLAVDGVAKTWGEDIFLVHVDGLGKRTFAHINPNTKSVTFTMTNIELAAELGVPYTPLFTLVGEFTYDPLADRLILADNSLALPPDFDYSLLAINVADGSATEILRSSDIAGWNSHGVLSPGVVVGTLGEERADFFPGEEPVVGLVDPANPAFVSVFDEDDFKDAIPGFDPNAELPPETIAVDPRNDDVYVFCHDELELFRIAEIECPEPHLEWLEIDGWNGVVDFHAMDVDEAGNLYGYDEGDPGIDVWDRENTFRVSLADVQSALGKDQPFVPTNWRGMKARQINATQSEVLLASASSAYGVVRIVFGEAPVELSIDADGDGLSDDFERESGTNPFLPNSRPGLADVNDDGVVDAADLDAIVAHIVGNATVGTFIPERADVTGDGAINVADVTQVANYLNGRVEVLR
jgi:hypothetical protein